MRQPPRDRGGAAARRKSLLFRILTLCITSAVTKSFLPIHREAPAFSEQSTELEILVTGIKARLQPPQRREQHPGIQGGPLDASGGSGAGRRLGWRLCLPLEGFL